MPNRNPAIDLYRIVLMFGICLLHCVHHGVHECRPLTMSLLFCVDGFVLISGWCGIRFSWRKIWQLYGAAVYASLVCALYLACCKGLALHAYFSAAIDILKGFWFLHAYVLMMLFTPCINAAFEKLDTKELVFATLPILAIPFVWSFAHDVPLIRRIVPTTNGLGAYSSFTFIGIYVLGRWMRRFESKVMVNYRLLMLSIVLLTMVCAVGFGRYHSPFAVALSLFWFIAFVRLSPPSWICTIISFITPSVFSIYLLHAHSAVGFPLIRSLENRVASVTGMNWLFVASSSALITFMTCLMFDLPRRAAVLVARRLVQKIGDRA